MNRDLVTRNRAILNIEGKRKMYKRADEADKSSDQSSLDGSEMTDISNEVTDLSINDDVHGE